MSRRSLSRDTEPGRPFVPGQQLGTRLHKEDDTASFWVEVVTVLLDWQKPYPGTADSIH
ncbi:hypothetical protein [Rhodospirillaceae bacterium SYSU D60014]|uniref:hypothetical protein n=1 Tax=Virgifigura deserti TaxID=2268457 RepID=UPI0013C4AFA9